MPNSISPKVLGAIKARQQKRAAAVESAHESNIVWCCATEAEECFNDLATLLRLFEATNN